jgi:hypothetical protein
MPPVRVIDIATFRAELEASMPVPSPDDPHFDAVLRRLGLIPESSTVDAEDIDDLVESLGAYYDDGMVTVIDRGTPLDQEEPVSVLVHEMVHAIQDRRYDLDAFLTEADDFDDRSMRRAIVEGDASVQQVAYMLEARGMPRERGNWNAALDREAVLEMLPGSGWFVGSLAGLYPLGLVYVLGRWNPTMPLDDLDLLYADPPDGTQALFSEASTSPSRELVECAVAPPEGTAIVSEQHFGTLVFYAAFRDTRLGFVDFSQVTGDQMVIVGDEAATQTAFVWRVRTASEETAQAMRIGIGAGRPPRVVAVDGRDLVIVDGTDAALVEAWLPIATAPCAP